MSSPLPVEVGSVVHHRVDMLVPGDRAALDERYEEYAVRWGLELIDIHQQIEGRLAIFIATLRVVDPERFRQEEKRFLKEKERREWRMNLKPLNDRVLISREEPETMTAGGLHIPEKAQDKPQLAKVEAVGPGRLVDGVRVPLDVKEGDTVVIGKWAGSELPNEPNRLIVREDEILAVVTP